MAAYDRLRKGVRQARIVGRYILHEAPLRLTEGRRVVDLSPRQLTVLAVIVRASGEIVSKSEFLETVWNGAFVDPANLCQTIYLLRKALGRLPDGGELIETVPRRGYRLAAKALRPPAEEVVGDKPAWGGFVQSGGPSAEEYFRLLVESIQEYAIYMLDCGGRIETWNPGIESNKGYAAEEVLGQHFSLFFVPEDIAAHVPERELAKAARHGRCSGEGWRLRKNGERFWASFVISAIRSPTGALLGYAKVVRDLTEKRKQEDTLLRAEALLRRERDHLIAVVESSMDALCVCEAVRNAGGEIEDFIFTYVNSNVDKMISIPRGVLLNGKMCQLLTIAHASGVFDECKRVVETGRTYTAEFPIDAAAIGGRWIRVQVVRFEDGLTIAASDISQKKQLERELSSLRNAHCAID